MNTVSTRNNNQAAQLVIICAAPMLEPYTGRCKYLPVYGAICRYIGPIPTAPAARQAQRTALRSRGHAPRPRTFPEASASVAQVAPVFFAATPTPTTSLRRGLHAGDLVDAPAPLSARRVRSGRSRLTGSGRRGRRLGPGRPRIAGALLLHASRHSRTLSSTGRILPCSLADSIPKTSRKVASPPK